MRPQVRLLLAALAALLLLALVIAVVVGGSSGRSSGSSPSAGAPSQFDGAPLPGAGAPDFTLTDQRGRPVSLRDYRGRVTILTFLYSTCRSACLVIAQQIRGALDELGPGVAALAVSVDPGADTPAHVRAFLERVSLN